MEMIERLESEVRSYVRSWPVVFSRAQGSVLYDEDDNSYIDFFSGAGSLNYGHNNPVMKSKLLDYIAGDGIVHSLDKATSAKIEFLKRFEEVILKPRDLKYKVQFPGPTGTNAVEAALKLARKVTGRENILCFTNAFHGMTLGSLSVTANSMKRRGAGVTLNHTTCMPFDGYLGEDFDTTTLIEAYMEDSAGGSGMDLPAAIILETVQGEGGVNRASDEWLLKIEKLRRKHGVLLIVDDIQVGCGRTGPFFSFESSGIDPDIVCLSKSLSGYGLPFAVTLLKPELDQWEPGEHNGTFRGHNLAFVTATAALNYWETDKLTNDVERKAGYVGAVLEQLASRCEDIGAEVRGCGLVQGIALDKEGAATEICRQAFERGLLVETSGAESQVVKVLPALTISDKELEMGLRILSEAFDAVVGGDSPSRHAAMAGR